MLTDYEKLLRRQRVWFQDIFCLEGNILKWNGIIIFSGVIESNPYIKTMIFIDKDSISTQGIFVRTQTTFSEYSLVKELLKDIDSVEEANKIILKKGGEVISRVDWK